MSEIWKKAAGRAGENVNLYVFLILAASVFSFGPTAVSETESVQPSNSLGNETPPVSSIYTRLILKVLGNGSIPSAQVDSSVKRDVELRVFETPGNIDYIGTEVSTVIRAPLGRVAEVLEGIDDYKKLLPGFEEIKILSRKGKQFDVFWEKIVPVFFIKNVRYTTTYWINDLSASRVAYRSQLKEPSGLKALDALVMIETLGTGTRYYELAFFDGDFGIISSLVPTKIWAASVDAVLHGVLSKKSRAENPGKSFEDIRTETEAEAKSYPIESYLKVKEKHPLYDEFRALPQ